jgi:hypothetical protein
MKILLISSQWAPKNQTGLGFASLQHFKYLIDQGYNVKCVSLDDDSKDYNLRIKSKINFILNFRKKIKEIKNIINNVQPDTIIVESLQSFISEIFLYYAFKINCRTILISHGVSIVPYKMSFKYIFRFLIYLFYLPILIYLTKKIDILYTLKKKEYDLRHLDTIFFSIFNKKKKIIKYNNTSRFKFSQMIENKKYNVRYFLCIGYLNDIKNQKIIIKIARKNKLLNFRIVYSSYDAKYFEELNKSITKYNLKNIKLIDSKETDIRYELKNCISIINTSITEVQPLSILEGFSYGKTYISGNIKNLTHLKCGINCKNLEQLIFNLNSLNENLNFVSDVEISVIDYYYEKFTTEINSKKFNLNEL